jgi:2-methylisocitrate lyase-like PEP mutase family enzyme
VAPTQQEKGKAFRALHEGDPFVIPNPWDAGSAKMLAGTGFKALATTSSGLAFTLGRPDGTVTLDEIIAHVDALREATDLPISVDLEHGYGPTPADVERAITSVAAAGAVGGSIEDYDRDAGRLYELGEAVERVSAAVAAARALDFPFTLTARAENHLRGNPDLDDTIARLLAFREAGADVLYAPRLTGVGEIEAICTAGERPVNVLAFPGLGLSFDEIVGAGAQRVSVGGWLALTAVQAAADAAERIIEAGDFSSLSAPSRIGEWLGS